MTSPLRDEMVERAARAVLAKWCIPQDQWHRDWEHDEPNFTPWQSACEVVAAALFSVRAVEVREALKQLRIDANRLCDRQLGGTYEADCRRSIAKADEALALPEEKKA